MHNVIACPRQPSVCDLHQASERHEKKEDLVV